MGLDSGIIVKESAATARHPDFFGRLEYWSDNYDICYWRKCWNVYHFISGLIDRPGENDLEEPLTEADISCVIEYLSSLNEENWEDEGGSIWTFEEQQPFLCAQTALLMELIDLMREDPEIVPYFYSNY